MRHLRTTLQFDSQRYRHAPLAIGAMIGRGRSVMFLVAIALGLMSLVGPSQTVSVSTPHLATALDNRLDDRAALTAGQRLAPTIPLPSPVQLASPVQTVTWEAANQEPNRARP